MPKRLITIGILSVVFGLGGLIAGARGIGLIVQGYWLSLPPPPPAPLPPLAPANVTPHAGDYASPMGLHRDDRQLIVAAVNRKIELSEDRRIILDRFLQDAGRDAFAAPPRLSQEVAAGLIREARQLERGPDGDAKIGPCLVVTAQGKLEINNRQVTFIRASDGRQLMLDASRFTDSAGKIRWSARTLDDWIEAARRHRPGGAMTGQQAAVLLRYAADEPVPRPPSRGQLEFPCAPEDMLGIEPNMGPIILCRLNGAGYFLLPDGRLADSSVYRWGFDPLTNQPLPLPPPPFTPALPGSLAAIQCLIGESIATTALALLLLFAGILTVARLRGAARCHRAWALARLPVIGVSLTLGAWYLSTVPPQFVPYLLGVLFGVAISAVYPIVVLTILTTSPAHRFYAERNQSVVLFPAELQQRWRGRWREMRQSSAGRVILGIGGAAAGLLGLGHLAFPILGLTHADPLTPVIVLQISASMVLLFSALFCMYWAVRKGTPS